MSACKSDASASRTRRSGGGIGLQDQIDVAVARSFIHRFLAQAFADPAADGWQWLCAGETKRTLATAVEAVRGNRREAADQHRAAQQQDATDGADDSLLPLFATENLESFQSDYNAAFGHGARGLCPINEIEYGDVKADPLFQPHRLADLAAFYHAFGLELAADAGERQDHLCLELEFMSVLAAKDAYALEHQLDEEALAGIRQAQGSFLREHLGRWTPGFTRRLERMVGDASPLSALARFTREFIAGECERFGLVPGSEELLLRPVDAMADSLCSSCGLNSLPPGATAATHET